uniref:Uncharacterized protein n=1 Tax=Trichobilharzia regenti TaxID=157069 RepID=A0AA85KIQ6_TRIRE|nr:unnamed protein product [Trichobilharzia regenti]
MFSLRSKANLIILVSLCIVNIMKIESALFTLPLVFDSDGEVFVEFTGVYYQLSEDLIVTIEHKGCRWTVDMTQPHGEELITKRGVREGTVLCEGESSP